jgi:hypothetical protein
MRHLSCTLVTVVTCFVAAAVAQDDRPKAATHPASVIEVGVQATGGQAIPRVEGKNLTPTLAGARRYEGRTVTWSVGGKAVVGQRPQELALWAIAQDPASSRVDPEDAGRKKLLPLRIVPGDGARWGDIVTLHDGAMQAGFNEVQIEGVVLPWLIPKVVAEPVVDGGVLVVPRAVFTELDDFRDSERPTFDVHQDGRIVFEGKVLFAWQPGKEDDLRLLHKTLAELRRSLEAKGRWGPRGLDKRPALDVAFLVRADVWAEWRDVRCLLIAAMEPEVGFWKIELAAAEKDMEAELRKKAADGAPPQKR